MTWLVIQPHNRRREFNKEVAHFNQVMARVLVLNASYEPLTIVSWRKALILWLTNKVEVVEFHSMWVHSAYHRFQLPSVLKLNRYVKGQKDGPIRFCRENVYLRDGHQCQYCGQRVPLSTLTLDHVVPVSHNGGHNWNNVVTACRTCNNKKGNRTPDQAGMPLLTRPYKPRWLPQREFAYHNEQMPISWGPYLGAVR